VLLAALHLIAGMFFVLGVSRLGTTSGEASA
jgi:hypothetical protein